MQRSLPVTQASYFRVKDRPGGEMRDLSTIRSCEAVSMAGKTGSDLEDLRALLAEVKALREDVERRGAALRSAWALARTGQSSRLEFSIFPIASRWASTT